MLDYEYGNVNLSPVMLSGDETGQISEQNRPVFDQYASQNLAGTTNFIYPETHFATASQDQPFHHPQNQNTISHFPIFFDPRAYTTSISSHACPHAPSMPAFEPAGFSFIPKSEPMVGEIEFSSRLGLNLGGRTYFSNSEDDFVSRLYHRSRLLDPGSVNSPRCQAEDCNADLTHAKHYHRRHKVCEFHSKAATVITAGLTQRFCQQCSRFHLLSEFDNGKRSCRRRLADHNRRRRKSLQNNQENNNFQERNAPGSSSDNLDRSPPDSGPSCHE